MLSFLHVLTTKILYFLPVVPNIYQKHFQWSFKISCFDSLYCVVQKLSFVLTYLSLLQHTRGSHAKILIWCLRWNLKLKTMHKCPLYLDLWKAYLNATFHCVAMSMGTLKNVEHLQHNTMKTLYIYLNIGKNLPNNVEAQHKHIYSYM